MAQTRPRGTDRSGGRAQSNLLGVVLLFGIVIAGSSLIVLGGTTVLNDAQQQSNAERATQELTLFDSRAAMVALGDAETQTIKLSGSGTYTSRDDAGYLTIVNNNYTGTGTEEVLYNATLGSMEYDNGDTSIAYQGGGVWRLDGEDSSTMVSPPEFHYRSATLTLPVIRVINEDSASGSIQATVESPDQSRRVFPNASRSYDGISRPYLNPIRDGTVTILVHSEYYLGWYEYFTQRTSGSPGFNPDNDTAWVTLETVEGSIGQFDMPPEGSSVNVRGMASGHPVDQFQVTLAEGTNWKNVHWSFYVDDANELFELHFHVPGGTKCQDGSPDTLSNDLDMSIFYQNTTGGRNIHEEWQSQSIGPSHYSVDCDTRELTVDLVPSSAPLTYKDIDGVPGNSGNKWIHSAPISSASPTSSSKTFDTAVSGHSADSGVGPFSVGQQEEMGFLVDHYLGLLAPNHDLTVTDGPGKGKGRIDEGGSGGILTFEEASGSQYLTFLHVTENNVTVNLD